MLSFLCTIFVWKVVCFGLRGVACFLSSLFCTIFVWKVSLFGVTDFFVCFFFECICLGMVFSCFFRLGIFVVLSNVFVWGDVSFEYVTFFLVVV